MRSFMTRLLKNEEGATAVEYAALLMTVSIVCVATMILVGTDIAAKVTALGSSLPVPP